MTEKHYEYRDENNWFIGKKGSLTHEISFFEADEQVWVRSLLNAITADESFYHLFIVQKKSDFKLIHFLADMINQEMGRHLTVGQRSGAILLTEEERILAIHLPQEGVLASDFFGEKVGVGDTILIATRNEGKTKEFRQLFAPLGLKVENLSDYPELPEVEETGVTFEGNARLKAETIAKLTGKMVIADDSGLKVDVLGGLPGVWSARFSGPDATDASNNAKLLHELAMVFDQKDRSAQFHTTLVVAAPGRESLVVEAEWAGYIATQPKGDNGFGYDPLFIVGETGRHAAELSAEEKNAISHRGLAVKKLMEVFPEWQAKQSL